MGRQTLTLRADIKETGVMAGRRRGAAAERTKNERSRRLRIDRHDGFQQQQPPETSDSPRQAHTHTHTQTSFFPITARSNLWLYSTRRDDELHGRHGIARSVENKNPGYNKEMLGV
ncbi:unnamed protein product [Angiostrongylus costaricensis]|uniref:Uncharacterized protein n=1 Tax=Angiostrongylus costaricensis TaxID=334426 RepID=A0A0R3P9I2_ANGCS|nr:unnamed protein product [Angiostrongylus costaricensis]